MRCRLLQCAFGPITGDPVAARNRVTVNLEDREYAELAALSDKHRVSLAWLGRQAIIEFLERRESEDLQLPLILSSERPPSGR